jgi:peptidoglycan/LPS O-acetylase OafA/YrhL
LTIEALFYLSLPLLVRAFHRRRALWSVPLALVLTLGWLYLARYSLGALVRFLMTHSLWPFPEWMVRFFLSKTFPAHLFDFAVGIAVARLVLRRPGSEENRARSGTRGGLFALGLGLLWLVLFLQLQGHNTVLHGWWDPERLTHSESASALAYYFLEQVGVAPAFGLLLFAAVRGPSIFERALSIPLLRLVGIVGYSIYLVHMPLLYQMNTLRWIGAIPPGRVRLLVSFCFGALLVTLVATSMFLAVEKPAMAMAKLQRLRTRPDGGEFPGPGTARSDLDPLQ